MTDSLWTGPYRIEKQVGENSYIIRMGRNESAAHADLLKLALEAGDEYEWSVAGAVLKPLPLEGKEPPWLEQVAVQRPHEAQAPDISAILREVNLRMPRQ